MTVKELKEQLSEYPDDTLVVVTGYEIGYDAVYALETLNACEKSNPRWWEGQFEKPFHNDSRPVIKIIHLKSRHK